jgi:hypothetical protein
MHRSLLHVKTATAALWRSDRLLAGTAFLLLGALVFFLAGLWLDPRTITGLPAWMKPAKFAISTAIYTLTLAWTFSYLPNWVRTRRIVGRTTAAVMVLEVAIIAVQAWRGTTSHFNVGTPLDATLFGIMGTAIALQTLTSVAVVVALWRQPFEDPALGWALRLGLAITIAGAMSGGLMTRPTAAQLEEAQATRITVVGAHTVGAPDGGEGLPALGWSRQHGDLRVPHFLGLHAFQLLPLTALVLRRRYLSRPRVRLVVTAAGSYAILFALAAWQALRGQSVLAPDMTTAVALLAWLALTVAVMSTRGTERGGTAPWRTEVLS